MRKAWLAFAVAGIIAVWSVPASASTIVNNGVPDDESGYQSDTTVADNQYEEYDAFTISTASTITGMEWWGYYYPDGAPPATDAFKYVITENTGYVYGNTATYGAPGTVVSSGTLDTLDVTRGSSAYTVVSGCTVYDYNAVDLTIPLLAGSYFLSIYDTDTYSDPAGVDSFGWCFSNESDPYGDWWSYYSSGGPSFIGTGPSTYDLAFNLTGNEGIVVPEPISLSFFVTGLVGLCGYVARRRNW